MRILNILLIISILFFYGCSKYEMYDWAIESNRNSANLELKDLKINDGKLVYLENKNINSNSNETFQIFQVMVIVLKQILKNIQ